MKIAVSVESTNDLSKELLDSFDIKVIPYEIVLNGDAYKDGELTTQQIFDFVDKTGILPKTTAINIYGYTEFFQALRKDYDAVIHISLSGEITSSTNNAIIAGKSVDNVFVVDSRTLSTGIGILALYARELANEGFEPKEIYERISKRIASLQVSFVIERLDYLYKGGRCNSLQLLGANLLKLRPRIILKDGKMINDKKYKGKMEHVISNYCQELLQEFNTPDLDKVFLTYSTATPEMLENARSILKERGFKNIYETRIGATVACHCGENTLEIVYFNDGK